MEVIDAETLLASQRTAVPVEDDSSFVDDLAPLDAALALQLLE